MDERAQLPDRVVRQTRRGRREFIRPSVDLGSKFLANHARIVRRFLDGTQAETPRAGLRTSRGVSHRVPVSPYPNACRIFPADTRCPFAGTDT